MSVCATFTFSVPSFDITPPNYCTLLCLPCTLEKNMYPFFVGPAGRRVGLGYSGFQCCGEHVLPQRRRKFFHSCKPLSEWIGHVRRRGRGFQNVMVRLGSAVFLLFPLCLVFYSLGCDVPCVLPQAYIYIPSPSI